MDSGINWLEPWDSLCVEPTYFEKELYREVGEQHVLFNKKVTALGRRYDCDDVLFQVHNSEFHFAVVHLTYSSKREKESKYPRTKIYKDLNNWINECMIPDHSDYTLDEE
jgi:signal recognition particle subunit SEC65